MAWNGTKAAQPCYFYSKGTCRKGNDCAFLHGDSLATATPPWAPRAAPRAAPRDTRQNIACRFFLRGTCLKGNDCPFSHAAGRSEAPAPNSSSSNRGGTTADEETADDDDGAGDDQDESQGWHRAMGGAVVVFGDGATVAKVSFASDFSAVRLRNVPVDATAASLAETLTSLGEAVSVQDVRIIPPPDDATDDATDAGNAASQADVRVEDPRFALRVCALPAMARYAPTAVSTTTTTTTTTSSRAASATGFQRVDSKKVHVSWHKATQLVFLNFDHEGKANTVYDCFRRGIYTVDGHCVGAKRGKSSNSSSSTVAVHSYLLRFIHSWTVTLSDVPADASEGAVTGQIPAAQRPKSVAMSYQRADADADADTDAYDVDAATAGAMIQSLLASAGPLEWWEESTGVLTSSKRHKAKARFVSETDAARAVDMFNGKPLPFHRNRPLTVQLVHAARIKVAAAVHTAATPAILSHVPAWKDKHVQFTAYQPVNGFRVLKLEGAVRQDVAAAKADLEAVLDGQLVLDKDGTTPLWAPALAGRGVGVGVGGVRQIQIQTDLKRLGIQHSVVVVRDRTKRQLRVVGTAPRQARAAAALVALVGALPPAAAAAAAGTSPQLGTAHPTHGSAAPVPSPTTTSGGGGGGQDVCTVCWTAPEDVVTTPCQHRYCSSCFEDMCHAGAARGVRCVSDAATCNTRLLPLAVLQANLSSAALETLLATAFEAHVTHHVDELRHCSTAGCDQVYRTGTASASASASASTDGVVAELLFTCPSCMAPVCRSCHGAHEGMSCADYQDQQTGGMQALQRAKTEFGIKDCPKCGTLIDKYEGCNHVTCTACGAHICWVCLKLFSREDIYPHLNREHGGYIDVI